MEEIWRKIEGYDDYSVSNLGNVRKDKTGKMMTLSKKQSQKKNGEKINYFTYWVSMTNDSVSKRYKVSRLVALAFIPNPENLPMVEHKDCNPLNNNVDNLKWCTQKDNTQSINTRKNFGYIDIKSKNSFTAKFTSNGNTYYKTYPNREDCKDWLDRRENEVINNLPLTEVNLSKYKDKRCNYFLFNAIFFSGGGY